MVAGVVAVDKCLQALAGAEQNGFRKTLRLPEQGADFPMGQGTGLTTQRECLEMLGCYGSGKARKLAEIVAAALLGGEISMASALASGEFAQAHERYGRNRPGESV